LGCRDGRGDDVNLLLPPLPHTNAEPPMTEARKYAILLAATLLSARRLIESIQWDKPDMAKAYFVDRAVEEAEFVLQRIDKKWPQS